MECLPEVGARQVWRGAGSAGGAAMGAMGGGHGTARGAAAGRGSEAKLRTSCPGVAQGGRLNGSWSAEQVPLFPARTVLANL